MYDNSLLDNNMKIIILSTYLIKFYLAFIFYFIFIH